MEENKINRNQVINQIRRLSIIFDNAMANGKANVPIIKKDKEALDIALSYLENNNNLDKLSEEIKADIEGFKRGEEMFGDDAGIYSINIQAYTNVLKLIDKYKGN